MGELPAVFDKEDFLDNLANAKDLLTTAEALASNFVKDGYTKLVFVGCGAPYRMVNLIKYWVDLQGLGNFIVNYLSADFMDIDPEFIDNHTVVVIGSYSGTTKETVEAAKFCETKECLRLGITRFDDSPLSQNVDISLNFGDVKLGDYSRFMVTTSFVNSFLNCIASDQWFQHEKIKEALINLPTVLANVVEVNEQRIQQLSEQYQDITSMYVVGHGSMYDIAYVLTFCSFVEMQKIHATPIIGAEFFHGPFELVDGSFPVFVLIGEDPTRPQGIRVKEFGEKYVGEFIIFDSKDYPMGGIAEDVRGLFAPVVLDAATRRFMDYFAAIRDHDKSQRRYMGVVDY